MSRTDEKGADGLGESADAQDVEEGGDSLNPAVASRRGDGREASGRPSMTLGRIGRASESSLANGQCPLADEGERARIIADIMQLIRDASMPETTRVAGLTLVGWLARRRQDETPHAIGIDEARESERRIRATRAKAR